MQEDNVLTFILCNCILNVWNSAQPCFSSLCLCIASNPKESNSQWGRLCCDGLYSRAVGTCHWSSHWPSTKRWASGSASVVQLHATLVKVIPMSTATINLYAAWIASGVSLGSLTFLTIAFLLICTEFNCGSARRDWNSLESFRAIDWDLITSSSSCAVALLTLGHHTKHKKRWKCQYTMVWQTCSKHVHSQKACRHHNTPIAHKERTVNWLMTSHPDYCLACITPTFSLYRNQPQALQSVFLASAYILMLTEMIQFNYNSYHTCRTLNRENQYRGCLEWAAEWSHKPRLCSLQSIFLVLTSAETAWVPALRWRLHSRSSVVLSPCEVGMSAVLSCASWLGVVIAEEQVASMKCLA